MARVSFDSNVLIYAADQNDRRQHRAIEVLDRAATGPGLLSLQALAEFFHVVTRRRIASRDLAEAQVEDWMKIFPIQRPDMESLREAIGVARRHAIPFWDAMLWATVKAGGCRFLLTEDLQNGRDLEGVRLVNPFDPANDGLIDLILPAPPVSA
ncbi:MAG TPA: PIN domain-containing protein [Geminicoccaceae bacterium]|nr:PIN domain-containing protein [Geminicoccus sp.]HMU51040.1 PIN domain-containing protein [Geminicoccaceae bacterium]